MLTLLTVSILSYNFEIFQVFYFISCFHVTEKYVFPLIFFPCVLFLSSTQIKVLTFKKQGRRRDGRRGLTFLSTSFVPDTVLAAFIILLNS